MKNFGTGGNGGNREENSVFSVFSCSNHCVLWSALSSGEKEVEDGGTLGGANSEGAARLAAVIRMTVAASPAFHLCLPISIGMSVCGRLWLNGHLFVLNSLLKNSPGEGTGPTSPMISEEIM